MLEQLAKKQDKWIKMSLSLCQDVDQAKDIVQEMYIKMYDISQKNPETKIRDVYVWVVMYNMVKDDYNLQQKYTQVPIEYALNIAIEDETIEFDDTELMYLNRAKEFRYLDRGLLLENYDKSLRTIQKEFDINYGFVYKTLEKTRKLILRDKYDELYKNKRLKYKK